MILPLNGVGRMVMWVELSWCYDRWLVGLSVLVSQIFLFPFFAGQLLCSSSWGVLSDERTGQ
jgi:hypothetical protein